MSPQPRAVLLDLLMATMNSIETWSHAAGDAERGLAWRDAVTGRMIVAGRYVAYDDLVAEAAVEVGLDPAAPGRLTEGWHAMMAWPDAVAVETLSVPYAFVTNCSAVLAALAADRSGLGPAFVLSAEEAGWYKPRPEIYRLACDRIGVRPGEVRFVAGSGYDAEGARAAGLDPVLVLRRPRPAGALEGIAVASGLADALGG